jgi:hypothetical protein
MSSQNNIKEAAVNTATYEKKAKEPTFGLEKPLSVKWKNDSIVGTYIYVAIGTSDTRTPTEFVISKLIGKSREIPKDSYVINRRTEVPELIKEAGDPMKKRHQEITERMQREELVNAGYIENVGAKYAITKTLSVELSGQDWKGYLDRSKNDFSKAMEAARAKHEEAEKAKPFRLRKKFIFGQTLQNFMNVHEKGVQVRINTVIQDPEFLTRVAEATKSDHQTLVGGEYQQKLLEFPGNWKEMSIQGISNELSKFVFKTLQGEKPKPGSEEEKLRLENLSLTRQLDEQKIREDRIHNYYKSSDAAIIEAESKISSLMKTIEDLQEEIQELRSARRQDEEEEELLGSSQKKVE